MIINDIKHIRFEDIELVIEAPDEVYQPVEELKQQTDVTRMFALIQKSSCKYISAPFTVLSNMQTQTSENFYNCCRDAKAARESLKLPFECEVTLANFYRSLRHFDCKSGEPEYHNLITSLTIDQAQGKHIAYPHYMNIYFVVWLHKLT